MDKLYSGFDNIYKFLSTWDRLVETRAPLSIMRNQRELVDRAMAGQLKLMLERGMPEGSAEMMQHLAMRCALMQTDLELLLARMEESEAGPYAEQNREYFRKQIEDLAVESATEAISGESAEG